MPIGIRRSDVCPANASITEIMIASVWSSSITCERRSSGHNSSNARTPACRLLRPDEGVQRLGFRVLGGSIQDVLAITHDRLVSLDLSIERSMGRRVRFAETVSRKQAVYILMLVSHDRLRAAGPAYIEHGNERVQSEALLDQHIFPRRVFGCRRGGCLCGRPILFDQREDWIDVRGRQRGHGRRVAAAGIGVLFSESAWGMGLSSLLGG